MSARKRHPQAPAPERFDQALAAGSAERFEHLGVEWIRLTEDWRGMPRGLLRVAGRVVPDYPHIARVFSLAAGMRTNFDAPCHVEEKIDGYNARIFRAGDGIAAVTRSGRPCPFTMDRLPELIEPAALGRFFDACPDGVLCTEIAGPGNPYMDVASPRGGDDVRAFVFDVLRLDSAGFEPLAERDRLLAAAGAPQAPRLGLFGPGEIDTLKAEVRRLDDEGAEGIVLKPAGPGLRAKYVCPGINVMDAASEAALELELPGAFYTQRLVRMVMAARELGQAERITALGERFGRELAEGFSRALDEVEASGELVQRHTVRLREAASADALLAHLNRGSRTIHAVEESREHDGRHWVVTFRKVFRRSTSRLASLRRGVPVFD
ncbi:RNA ligase [Arhodomonas aquaeolei]|uniref:RNA ligase n=1 Tax=Arhodomonas aquaeolei TaxID=2369 RepID=UPI000367E632|nr:RNA ligase [Arhodomonas aquaeolei]